MARISQAGFLAADAVISAMKDRALFAVDSFEKAAFEVVDQVRGVPFGTSEDAGGGCLMAHEVSEALQALFAEMDVRTTTETLVCCRGYTPESMAYSAVLDLDLLDAGRSTGDAPQMRFSLGSDDGEDAMTTASLRVPADAFFEGKEALLFVIRRDVAAAAIRAELLPVRSGDEGEDDGDEDDEESDG